MRMRTFIQVKAARGGATVSSHARYMSERERNPNREEPESRPVFTHDRDGLKHKAADRYLAGGEQPRASSDSLLHLIISFNSYDRKEMEKLERAAKGGRPKSNPPDSERKKGKESISDKSETLQAQVARDLPYARAVRMMMENLEERTGRSDLRYALSVHRHTRQTHVHLLLRREHTDKKTGEKIYFDKKGLPAEFVNGRDERGKARGGLIDQSLSDALDTMIPRRLRPLAQSLRQPEPSRSDGLSAEKTDQLLTIELGGQEPSRNRGQNLGYRNSLTPTSGHEAQTNKGRQRAEAPHLQPMPTSSGSPRIELAPRYSTTRKQTGADTPDSKRTISPHQPPSTRQARAAAPGETLTGSQTDQLLVSAVQLLDQILNFERFSKPPGGRPNDRVENYFSPASESETLPPNRLEPVGHAVEGRHATLITLDTSLPPPTRYSTTRRQPHTTRNEAFSTSDNGRPDRRGKATTAIGPQPPTGEPEVHIVTTKVHDQGHNVNFEASRTSPERHPDTGRENIFSTPDEAVRQAVDPLPAVRPGYLPIKQLVKLERPDLVPVEEKLRSSPTRSR